MAFVYLLVNNLILLTGSEYFVCFLVKVTSIRIECLQEGEFII